MIVVLIHWRIKSSAVDEFLNWWQTVALTKDKANLIGEYLSAPMPASSFKFAVNDLAPGAGEPPHTAFMNVGLWKDWQSFFDAVGHNFDDNKPLQPFEAARRTRTILDPKAWRRGDFELSNTSTCG